MPAVTAQMGWNGWAGAAAGGEAAAPDLSFRSGPSRPPAPPRHGDQMPTMTAAVGQERPEPTGFRVVVVVGTDHHPFDRLIDWVNGWLVTHPEQVPGFFVQSGSTSVVPACPGSQWLDAKRLDAMLDDADVIVSHGGPASIAAAWSRGLLPIVVPRLSQLGEHIDDHQLDFSLKMAELGRIRLAQTSAEFVGIMTAATGDPARLRASVPAADVDAAVAQFGELVEELVSRARRRLPLWHRIRESTVGGIRPFHLGGKYAARADLRPEGKPALPRGQPRSDAPRELNNVEQDKS
jgi:UDP-N-acetylglucosamine transferase subunit ALG13